MNMRSPRTAVRLALMLSVVLLILIGNVLQCFAEPRRAHRRVARNERPLPWLGNPTERMYYGNRKIDGYRSGGTVLWYEGNNLVGVNRR